MRVEGAESQAPVAIGIIILMTCLMAGMLCSFSELFLIITVPDTGLQKVGVFSAILQMKNLRLRQVRSLSELYSL